MLKSFAQSFAALRERPGIQGKQPGLVERNRQRLGVEVEGLLRAVAMMNVPVDHGHPTEPVRLPGLHEGDRHIGEQAKAEAAVTLGMMAGRSHQGIAVAHPARQDGVDDGARAADRQRGDVEAPRPERREMAGVAAPVRAQRLDARDVVARVEEREIVLAGRRSGQDRQTIEQARHFQKIAEAAFRGGILGVFARLDRQARREQRRRVAGVVPEVEFMEVPTRRHCGPPSHRSGTPKRGRWDRLSRTLPQRPAPGCPPREPRRSASRSAGPRW